MSEAVEDTVRGALLFRGTAAYRCEGSLLQGVSLQSFSMRASLQHRALVFKLSRCTVQLMSIQHSEVAWAAEGCVWYSASFVTLLLVAKV